MNEKAECLLALMRRSLKEAAECERNGDHTTAELCGQFAAMQLEQALILEGALHETGKPTLRLVSSR